MAFNPYPPAYVFTAEQLDELDDKDDGTPASDLANELGRGGAALFPGSDPANIPGLDAGEPAGLVPASATVAGAGAVLIVPNGSDFGAPLVGQLGPAADGDGTELLGSDDLIIPRLRVKNPLTKSADQVPEGSFFLSTDTEEHTTALRLAVLQITPKREVKIPMDDDKRDALLTRIAIKLGRPLPVADDAWALCTSADRVRPDAGITAPLAETCGSCQFGEWRREGGKNYRECQEIYEVAATDIDTMQPMLYTMRGGSAKPAKKLNTMLKMRLRRMKGEGKAWHYFTPVTLDRIAGKKNQGHYYLPNFGRLEDIEDEGIQADLASMRDDLVGARFAPDVPDAAE